MGTGMARLEAAIGHTFADRDLLVRALTHRSGGADNFERLEFLGDAVLGYVMARRLFENHPHASEEELTLMRASLVRKETLSEVARDSDIGRNLRLGTGERASASTIGLRCWPTRWKPCSARWLWMGASKRRRRWWTDCSMTGFSISTAPS